MLWGVPLAIGSSRPWRLGSLRRFRRTKQTGQKRTNAATMLTGHVVILKLGVETTRSSTPDLRNSRTDGPE